MAGGLIAYNDGGVAQIDSEHRNLRFKSSGSFTMNIGVQGFGYPAGSILAFASSKPARMYYDTDGSATVESLTTANVIDWWTFEVGTTAVFNSGIRIFNPAGEQVFDGADRLPKVVGFAQTLGGTFNTGAARVAVAMSPGTPQFIPTGSPGAGKYDVFVSCSGGTVTAQLLADSPFGGSTFIIPNACQLLMLDVAGL